MSTLITAWNTKSLPPKDTDSSPASTAIETPKDSSHIDKNEQSVEYPIQSLNWSAEDVFTELVTRLRRLLSRHNISVDPSVAMLLQMDSGSLYISAEVLLQHPVIASLYIDDKVVLRAAEAVGQGLIRVDLEAKRLYPVMKAERCTLILRDLETDVSALSDFLDKCPYTQSNSNVVSIVEATVINSKTTWFVTLKTAEQAAETALWLRTQTFNDQPLKVAIKSETEYQSCTARATPNYNPEGVFVPSQMANRTTRRPKPIHNNHVGGVGVTRRPARSRGLTRQHANWQPQNRQSKAPRGTGRGTTNKRRATGRWTNQPANPHNQTADPFPLKVKTIQQAINYPQEVDPAEFPPLFEAVKLTRNAGYGTRDFRKYTLETLRKIQHDMSVTDER